MKNIFRFSVLTLVSFMSSVFSAENLPRFELGELIDREVQKNTVEI